MKTRGFVDLDVGWSVKIRGFVDPDVRWSVKTRGFVDLGVKWKSKPGDSSGPSAVDKLLFRCVRVFSIVFS